MKKEKVFKPRKYRVVSNKGAFSPQVKILFFWCNIDKAFRSKGEADKSINRHNSERARRFYKTNER